MRRRTGPSPALVIACVALFVALGGTGYAASSGALDGSGKASVAKKKKTSNRGPRGLRGLRGLAGARGPQGLQGPQGPGGSQGPAGTAKAFAEVSSAGAVVAGHALNIVTANITNPSTGVYCLNLSGIGITNANAVPVVSLDYTDANTTSGEDAHVIAGSTFNPCPTGQVGVRTYNVSNALDPAGFTIAFM